MTTLHTNLTTSTTIAILTDIHFGNPSGLTQRRTDIADILLLRAVHRLNRYLKPDITVVLGDILDAGDAPEAIAQRLHIRNILKKLKSPVLVIPGNHDGDVEAFYQDFPRPEPVMQIEGVRFLPFIDAEAPGYNATRAAMDIQRFQRARSDYNGPIVALQHVCLHPPMRADIPYNYTNAETIIEAMQHAGVGLSLSGHYHEGAEPISDQGTLYVNAPGLCESPFRFTMVRMDNSGVEVETEKLAMPEAYRLVDRHVHTQLAYCQENMTVEKAIAFAGDFGLSGVGFAEHSGQLYFPSDGYWGGDCYRTGIQGAQPQDERMPDYYQLQAQFGDHRVRFGLEVDIDFHGRLLLKAVDRQNADFTIGSVHSTPNIKTPGVQITDIMSEFMFLLEKLLIHNVDILAHPFRVFKRARLDTPDNLFAPVADLLVKYGTAAEINFHSNVPPLPFIEACLQREVKFSLGSDAHNLYEVGEFAPHLKLLRDAGFEGNLDDILLPRDVGGFG